MLIVVDDHVQGFCNVGQPRLFITGMSHISGELGI